MRLCWKAPQIWGFAFRKRLKGFEPSTYCMAISSSLLQTTPKCLQIRRYRPR
jgi:hypothetical protein